MNLYVRHKVMTGSGQCVFLLRRPACICHVLSYSLLHRACNEHALLSQLIASKHTERLYYCSCQRLNHHQMLSRCIPVNLFTDFAMVLWLNIHAQAAVQVMWAWNIPFLDCCVV